ncbi:MAG: transglycosylase domain-containing protein [Deltaproteobacteria bacterium]|nr:transglycosylase domain-containing protein [Deltaproteobacteria bacterium]
MRDNPVIITDRKHKVLRRVRANHSLRRVDFVKLGNISKYAIDTLVVSEDKNFYTHRGIDLSAVFRAAVLDIKSGGLKYGASTITMQLMRMINSKGQRRTFYNKIKEATLALRSEQILSKNEILELYLNSADFGNGAIGIEEAAFTYFNKSADALTLSEAVFLMVLPRGSSYYNPLRHYSRVLKRRDHLLQLLLKNRKISKPDMDNALKKKPVVSLHKHPFKAEHFVNYVLDNVDKDTVKNGAIIVTTLDLNIQKRVEALTALHVKKFKERGVNQAGAVVLDSQSGEILAMAGSAGDDSLNGKINITARKRYPGSALKPFVYGEAIEQGLSPKSLIDDIADVPSAYKIDRPVKEHGRVPLKEALAGSYNLAAVHLLEKIGIHKVLEKMKLAGISQFTLPKESYGLRLALGSAKTTLVDLASAYGFIVREGKVVPGRSILKIELNNYKTIQVKSLKEKQIFSKETAWQVMEMLSDNDARYKVFGYDVPADLPYKVVAKSGTAKGFSDVVAIFATKELTAAAWTGRVDGRPTKGVLGLEGAGPLARAALLAASKGKTLTLPKKPNTLMSNF